MKVELSREIHKINKMQRYQNHRLEGELSGQGNIDGFNAQELYYRKLFPNQLRQHRDIQEIVEQFEFRAKVP